MDFACLLDDDDVSTVPLTLSGSGVGRASRVRASRRRLDFPLDDALLAHELTVGMLGREALAFVLPEGGSPGRRPVLFEEWTTRSTTRLSRGRASRLSSSGVSRPAMAAAVTPRSDPKRVQRLPGGRSAILGILVHSAIGCLVEPYSLCVATHHGDMSRGPPCGTWDQRGGDRFEATSFPGA